MSGTTGTPGTNFLIAVMRELAGPQCAAGYMQVQVSPNVSRDGTLPSAGNTSYVCAGLASAAGTMAVAGLTGVSQSKLQFKKCHCLI